MSPPPGVSVVVTCYNYGRFLDACLSSVLGQSYRNLEVIVVDDGSTDDTQLGVRKWLADARLRYLRQENQGQAAAKNAGIAATSLELVAFLDADDWWHPEKLERQLPLFADPDVGVVYSRARYVGEDGRDNGFVLRGPYLQPRRGRITDWLLFDNFIPFSSSVVRRQVLRQIGGFDQRLEMSIDWDLWLRISTDHGFDYVDEPLLFYRMGHPDQMSRRSDRRLKCCETIFERFLAAHEEVLDRRVVREARVYTWLSRARLFERADRRRALRCYFKAIGHKPLQTAAYKGLLRASLTRGES